MKDLLKITKPYVLLIQETKMDVQTFLQAVPSFWSKAHCLAASSRGASGGLATLWDPTKVELVSSVTASHWIFTEIIILEENIRLSLFNVYAPVALSEKHLCWSSLNEYMSTSLRDNYVIAGDLNLTLSSEEKRGGNIVRDPAREWVEDIISDWDLEDIKPHRGKYTWTNKRLGPGFIAARLDRFLVQQSLHIQGFDLSSSILPFNASDHKPIALVFNKDQNLGPIPFRFNPAWIPLEGFQDIVAAAWNSQIKGSAFYVWEEKLRILKKMLKDWAKSLKSPLKQRLEAEKALGDHQLSTEGGLDRASLDKEVLLHNNLIEACRIEENYWKIKSRNLWLQEGDKNTKFFHKQAEIRKHFKTVSKIDYLGNQLSSFEEIKLAAHDHFKEIYTETSLEMDFSRSDILKNIPQLVSEQSNRKLLRPITLEEVKSVVESMNPDKAPGPDGFTARFLTSCWSIIHPDLFRMVKKSFSCRKLGGGTNSSFLALIPKEKGASSFSRYRPISLCNIGYKVITKILASRMKDVLPLIIPENQGGFIKGRQISDNILLVQEAIHSSVKSKEKGMAIKLDLSNAFDRVRHDFLFQVMLKLGFAPELLSWIKACISKPWIAPLVNGRATSFFQASRGLRQGCPLSPILYAVQAASLSFRLEHARTHENLLGIRIVRGIKEVNHTQFADDTLLLGGATPYAAKKFKEVLDNYQYVSGSLINYSKSQVYSWNCTPLDLQVLSRILKIEGKHQWNDFKYLGVPIFRSIPKVSSWDPLIEKLKAKIKAWGASWLNLAGKSVLIKSVLASMPVFQCSMLLAPITVLKKIEALLRRFLWKGGNQNENKLPLVKWEKVTVPYLEGGLHLRDLRAQNIALGAKFLWNMVSGKPSWSKQVLWKKYFSGTRLRCLDQGPKANKGSTLFALCSKALPFFTERLSWIPGNGKKIRIWEDSISGSPPLGTMEGMGGIQRFLSDRGLYKLADISKWHQEGRHIWTGWDIPECPPHLKAEKDLLLNCLHGKSPVAKHLKDVRGWGSKSGHYSVAEGYRSIKALPHVPRNPAIWKFIWSSKSIPKVDHFAWTLAHKSALTAEVLRRKGWEGPSRCPLCYAAEESSPHLFLACPFAAEVWELVSQPWNCPLQFEDVPSLFSQWHLSSLAGMQAKGPLAFAWTNLPKFTFWKLWIERNNRIFRGVCSAPIQVAAQVKALLGDCVRSHSPFCIQTPLSQDEEGWLNSLNPGITLDYSPRIQALEKWEIRKEEPEFELWCKNLGRNLLFFDGASKGNPGNAGGGGVLYGPDGEMKLSYSWNLGTESNNVAEALALWQGLNQAIIQRMQDLTVVGDSKLVINFLNTNSLPSSYRLCQVLRRIFLLIPSFRNIEFYHVLRKNNGQADKAANEAIPLGKGVLKVNEDLCLGAIP